MSSGTESSEKQKQQHHFVLIHGVCHGAWSWYRVTTALKAAGHRVTALDMPGCGASPGRGEEVPSFEEYSRPVLDAVAALPEGERAVIVAHSFGGQTLARARRRQDTAFARPVRDAPVRSFWPDGVIPHLDRIYRLEDGLVPHDSIPNTAIFGTVPTLEPNAR